MKHIITPSLLALSGLFLSLPAQGQVLENLFTVDEDKAETYLDAGGAVLYRPGYLGSDDNVTQLIPYIDGEYKGRFYLKPGQGAGINVINNKYIRLSGGVNYLFGRDSSENDTAQSFGLQDIDGSITAAAALRINTPIGVIDTQYQQPISGDLEGYRVDVAAITQWDPTPKLRINPGLRVTFMDEEMINQFYDVPKTITFEGSGVSSYSAFAAAYYDVTDKWQVIGLVDYAILDDVLADSPLADRDDGVTATLGVAYSFR